MNEVREVQNRVAGRARRASRARRAGPSQRAGALRLPVALACAILLAFTVAAPSQADDADLEKRIEQLERNVELQRQQLQQSLEEIARLKEEVAKKPKVKISRDKLQIESADGDFAFRVGGRLMADVATFDDDETDIGSGAEIRRVRLFMEGRLFRDWHFKNQFDFADNKVSVKDAYLAYAGFKPMAITIGNSKEPFSLEELTSSKYITFMERALPNEFAPGRNLGLKVTAGGKHYSAGLGVFADGIDSGGGVGNDTDVGVTGRLTYAPIAEKTRVVHLGVGATFRTNNDGGTLTLSETPEAHNSPKFVDTGSLAAVEDFWKVGPELAIVYGPLSLQSEYIHTEINRGTDVSGTALSDLTFNGWYIYGSWFPTGQSRAYSAKNGAFSRIKDAYNAVELAARFSTIDLTDGGVRGGEEDNITFGLNYYFNPHVRAMLNFIHADIDDGPTGDEEPNVVQARFQVDF